MKLHYKIIIGAFIALILTLGATLPLHKMISVWRWDNAAVAAGSMPYQIGLTGVTIVPCVVSCSGGCCAGGALCSVKAPGICATYATVTGAPAGGMGSMALFSQMAIGMVGLSQGGQLIAGGTTMTEMDSGVLASAGGCYGSGCVARTDWKDRVFAVLERMDKFIIAKF